MTRTSKPGWDRVASWLRSWDPETTRRASWGAVAVIACALLWPVLAPGGEVPTPTSPPARSDIAARPSAPAGPDTDCPVLDPPPEPTPAGLEAVSTSVVGRNAIVESTRWAPDDRRRASGAWPRSPSAATVRLDAVWFEPDGQQAPAPVSDAGRPVTGVVANGLDGAISVYTVRADRPRSDLGGAAHQHGLGPDVAGACRCPASAEPHVRAGVLSPSWRRVERPRDLSPRPSAGDGGAAGGQPSRIGMRTPCSAAVRSAMS